MPVYQEPASGYIYVIWAVGTNRYKIGRTKDPSRRVEQLNRQSCYPLKLLDFQYYENSLERERQLHYTFRDYRVYGEWFELPSAFLSTLKNWIEDKRCIHIKLVKQKTGLTLIRSVSNGENRKATKEVLPAYNTQLNWDEILKTPQSIDRAIGLLGAIANSQTITPKKLGELRKIIGIKLKSTDIREANALKAELKKIKKTLEAN